MSVQSINTAFIPSPRFAQGKTSAEKVKVTPAEGQAQSSGDIKKIDPEDLTRIQKKLATSIGTELSFSVDRELNEVIIKITDKNTKEVIRQIPSEEMIDLAKRLQELESSGDVKGIIVGLKG